MKELAENKAGFNIFLAILRLFAVSFNSWEFIKNAWCGELLVWLVIKTKLADAALTINGSEEFM